VAVAAVTRDGGGSDMVKKGRCLGGDGFALM